MNLTERDLTSGRSLNKYDDSPLLKKLKLIYLTHHKVFYFLARIHEHGRLEVHQDQSFHY